MGPSRLQAPSSSEEVIRLITVALRNFSMYSHEHPAFLKVMDQLVGALQSIFHERERFSLQVVRDQVLVDQRVLLLSPLLKGFASDLQQRGIQGITIAKGVSQREILVLLEILARRSAEGSEGLSCEEELRSKGVVRLWIHPFRAQMLDGGGAFSEALLERLLVGEGAGGERRDALAQFLTRDPQAIGQAVSRMATSEQGDEGERARWASERLLALMEQLLAGHSEDWDRFKDRLAQVLLSVEVQTQLEFFHRSLLQKGEASLWARELAAAIPKGTLADLVSQEVISSRETAEKKKFLQALIPDPEKRRELLPEVEQKLAEYGVSKEEFLSILGEEMPPLDQRVLLFLQDPGLTPEAIQGAPGLVQELLNDGNREDAPRVVNRFFNALNHPEWEVRKAVAEQMSAMFEVVSGMEATGETLKKVREFAYRKMLAEPDREVFRAIYEALEGVAIGYLTGGETASGVDLLQKIHAAPGMTALEPSYLAQRRETIQKHLLEKTIVEEAIRAVGGGTDAEAQRAFQVIRLMGEEGARRIIELLGVERQVSRRIRLIRVLQELGDTALEPLKRALLDPRWYLVRNVVKVLAEVKDSRVVPALLGLLTHPEPKVRKEVLQALGRIATPKAQEGILSALEDDNEAVRVKAVEVLQVLGASGAREKLRVMVSRSDGRTPRDSILRIKALRALGALGHEEDVPVFEGLLARKGLFSKMESEEIRRSAVIALAGILERTRSPRARQLLETAARLDPSMEIRGVAEQALVTLQETARETNQEAANSDREGVGSKQ